MSELKPCPFCGGKAWVIQILEDLYAVECRKCWTRTGTYQPTEAEAIKVWNRRAERTAKVETYTDDQQETWSVCECGTDVWKSYNYCPECGAKLDWSKE